MFDMDEKLADPGGSEHASTGFFENISRSAKQRFKSKKKPRPEADVPASKPRRANVMSRNGWKLEINEDDVLEVANWNEKFVRGPLVLEDLPKFDDTLNYGIDKDEENRLVRLEVKRLIKDCVSESPLLFNSDNILGTTKPEAFKIISDFADQILCNLAIVSHDNQLLILEHSRAGVELEKAASQFKLARGTLRRKFQQNEKVKPRIPIRIEPEADNTKVYFALVDYATSSVARVLLRLASSKFWKSVNIAVLARWAVKLKVLCHDPVTYARQALSDGEAIIEQLNASEDTEMFRIIRIRIGASQRPDAGGENGYDVHEETDATQLYFSYNGMVRVWLESIFRSCILGLYSTQWFLTAPSTFEVCTVVYEVGLSHSLTTLSADRDGDVFATSQTQSISCIYVVLKLLLEVVEALKAQEQPDNSQEKTLVRWRWAEGRKGQNTVEKSLQTSSADEVISALILLSLSTSYVCDRMLKMISNISVNSEEEDPVFQFAPKHFQAKFVVASADYLSRKRRLGFTDQWYNDPETIPVSGDLFSKRIRAGTQLGLDRTRLQELPALDQPELVDTKKEMQVVQQYVKEEKRMQSWVFAETSVTVRCTGYIMAIMGLCAVVLGGGLAIPFVVRNEIVGVDPFQITTFTWLIVGVILIVAKTRYVTEWPWHDFLHGRVVCKSVSDLAEVTGVDAQLILTKLLYDERNTTVVTRGPYNGMFSRRPEGPGSDGFSIDVPAQLSTMLVSGFIILKVLSSTGEHLITLDVRKGTELDYAAHDGVDLKYLACLDLGKRDFEDEEEDQIPKPKAERRVLYLVQNKVHYTKVLGLYICDALFG
ncbi:hypothetical protein PV08_10325 [Exophiala spinifera]|uniref:Uncharacterized protein n=1 Tax=Exophiala spinifera TaxID=91928 RepID=A0A0D1Y7Y9_9EURO|nr:uncharacterized protein PV08_10325 [Exophiala spinifera]KIW11026.1 hypothetical protein PV08_10325 [Exophiala spinifera]